MSPMDCNTLTAFGKHLAVCGVIDKIVHTSIATTNEISSHIPFGILPMMSAPPLLFFPILILLFLFVSAFRTKTYFLFVIVWLLSPIWG